MGARESMAGTRARHREPPWTLASGRGRVRCSMPRSRGSMASAARFSTRHVAETSACARRWRRCSPRTTVQATSSSGRYSRRLPICSWLVTASLSMAASSARTSVPGTRSAAVAWGSSISRTTRVCPAAWHSRRFLRARPRPAPPRAAPAGSASRRRAVSSRHRDRLRTRGDSVTSCTWPVNTFLVRRSGR